ncbi:hypothetical protein Tchar_00743 [Tepidimonas charontis]|uniref:Uncharacterized protein n=1 Tax=Tepidimonas charontis TaxID=2267262 RepID=A0A554XI90_9BURK|nr:hypothetical protein Tchar_00743 [Tepidimonas charontis]
MAPWADTERTAGRRAWVLSAAEERVLHRWVPSGTPVRAPARGSTMVQRKAAAMAWTQRCEAVRVGGHADRYRRGGVCKTLPCA